MSSMMLPPSPDRPLDYPPPNVYSIVPETGNRSGGTLVTVNGQGFGSAVFPKPRVTFEGVNSPSVFRLSNTQLMAATPPGHVGPALVTVLFGEYHQSAQRVYFYYDGVAPVPVINAIGPIPAGRISGGNVVTITKLNFSYVTQVLFGSTPAISFAILSDTVIAAVVPPHPPGPCTVTVTSKGGTSNGLSYTYTQQSIPTVVSVNPSGGPVTGGNTVIITGTGFSYASIVTFGSSIVTSFRVVSDSSTSVVVFPGPKNGGDVPVLVTGPGGTSSPGPTYTYEGPVSPSITELVPSSGPVAGGNTITIRGLNLNTVTGVVFASNPVPSFTIL